MRPRWPAQKWGPPGAAIAIFRDASVSPSCCRIRDEAAPSLNQVHQCLAHRTKHIQSAVRMPVQFANDVLAACEDSPAHNACSFDFFDSQSACRDDKAYDPHSATRLTNGPDQRQLPKTE